MEEKLKAPDGQSGDSEVRLFQRCQELQALVQEKEDVIAQLEQQLEEQVRHVHTMNLIKATDVALADVQKKTCKQHKNPWFRVIKFLFFSCAPGWKAAVMLWEFG